MTKKKEVGELLDTGVEILYNYYKIDLKNRDTCLSCNIPKCKLDINGDCDIVGGARARDYYAHHDEYIKKQAAYRRRRKEKKDAECNQEVSI